MNGRSLLYGKKLTFILSPISPDMMGFAALPFSAPRWVHLDMTAHTQAASEMTQPVIFNHRHEPIWILVRIHVFTLQSVPIADRALVI